MFVVQSKRFTDIAKYSWTHIIHPIHSPLGDIARSHGLGNHFYVDDSQLYIALKNAKSIQKLEKCIWRRVSD